MGVVRVQVRRETLAYVQVAVYIGMITLVVVEAALTVV